MGEHVGKMEENTNAEKMRKITIERAEKFLSKEEWKDVNLWGKLYSAACPDSVKLKVWSVPDTDPNNTDRVSYEDMRKQPESAFREAKIGETFGPEWSTHWFKGIPFYVSMYTFLSLSATGVPANRGVEPTLTLRKLAITHHFGSRRLYCS